MPHSTCEHCTTSCTICCVCSNAHILVPTTHWLTMHLDHLRDIFKHQSKNRYILEDVGTIWLLQAITRTSNHPSKLLPSSRFRLETLSITYFMLWILQWKNKGVLMRSDFDLCHCSTAWRPSSISIFEGGRLLFRWKAFFGQPLCTYIFNEERSLSCPILPYPRRLGILVTLILILVIVSWNWTYENSSLLKSLT